MVKKVRENPKASDIAESKRRKSFKEGLLTVSDVTKRSSKVKAGNCPFCSALRESPVTLARAASVEQYGWELDCSGLNWEVKK